MTLDLLLLGLAIALEPLPVSAQILLLGSEGGTRKGAGYVLGWLLTLVSIVVASVALTGGNPPAADSAPSRASLVVKILLGAALLVFAWRKGSQHDRRPAAEPRWMARLDKVGFVAAMGLGFLLQPWPLVAAGAATVIQADVSHASTLVALVAFCLLATSTYLVMEGYAIVAPEAARTRLDGLNSWISTHRDQLVVVVSVVVGLWLVAASAYQLVL